MTTVRLHLVGERIGPQLKRSAVKIKGKVHTAAKGAAEEVVEYVVPRARNDISGAGRFGARWTTAFNGKVTQGGGFIKIDFTMDGKPPVKYWRVFEHGAVIKGKPMLWIPLSFAGDAQNVLARDYPGKLFRVNRIGKAPLLATGDPFAPKYFGKPQVTIPQKFHLRDIIRDGSKQLKLFYTQRMKSNG